MVLSLLSHSKDAKQIMVSKEQAVWLAKDSEEDACYLAVFNLNNESRRYR
jgi:hypothetical protein